MSMFMIQNYLIRSLLSTGLPIGPHLLFAQYVFTNLNGHLPCYMALRSGNSQENEIIVGWEIMEFSTEDSECWKILLN
jgi:hypothetical protein